MTDRLSARDTEIIRECVTAAVHGPFFPDWEFDTLFELTRDEIAQVLADWPASEDDEKQDVAVHDAFNNLLRYPHGGRRWSEFISVSSDDVAPVWARWRRKG